MSNPFFLTDPSIALTSGSGQPGSVLTATDAQPIASGTAVGRQWYRAGVPIAGATGSTYTIQDDDVLLQISFANFVNSERSNAVTPAPARIPYRYYKIIVTRSSTSADSNISSLAEIQAKDPQGNIVSGTWAATQTGNVGYLNDGNPATAFYISTGATPKAITFTAPAAFELADLLFKSRSTGIGAQEAPGSFKVYGSNTVSDTSPTSLTGWTELLSVTYPGGINVYAYSNTKFVDWNVPPIEGLGISVTNATKYIGAQDFDIVATDMTGGSGQTQIRVVNVATGNVAIDWQAPSSPLRVPAGGFYRFDIRNSQFPADVVSTTSDKVAHGLQPMMLGQNLGFMYSSAMTSDLLRFGGWRYNYDLLAAPGFDANFLVGEYQPGSIVGMGLNGLPQSLPTGNYIRMALPPHLPPSMIGRTYSFVTDPGVVLDVGGSGGDRTAAAARGFVLAATTTSGGVQTTKFTIGSQYNDNIAAGNCYLTIKAIPSGMSHASFSPDGYVDEFVSEFVQDLDFAKIVRVMTPTFTNYKATATDPGNRATESAISWPSSSGLPIETAIGLCNEAGSDLWLNIPIFADDALISLYADLCSERLDAGRRVYVEFSNEIWNSIFSQYYAAAYQGLLRGYGPDGATPSTSVAETILSNGFANSNALKVAVSAGDKIMCPISGQGILVYQAQGAFDVGQALPTNGASDGNFTLVYTNAQCAQARWRFQSSRSKEAWSIFSAALGPDRLRRCLMSQGGALSYWQTLLDWDDCYAATDVFGHALYFGCDLGYTNSTAALRAVTNQSDWIAAYVTAMNAAVATTRSQVKTCAEWLDAYKASKGVDQGSVIFGAYEGGRNEGPPAGDWTEAGGLATVTQWWIAARRDAGLTGVIGNWCSAIAAEAGGPICYFCDTQPILTGTANKPGWGAKEYTGQTGAPVWTALASFTPPS